MTVALARIIAVVSILPCVPACGSESVVSGAWEATFNSMPTVLLSDGSYPGAREPVSALAVGSQRWSRKFPAASARSSPSRGHTKRRANWRPILLPYYGE